MIGEQYWMQLDPDINFMKTASGEIIYMNLIHLISNLYDYFVM